MAVAMILDRAGFDEEVVIAGPAPRPRRGHRRHPRRGPRARSATGSRRSWRAARRRSSTPRGGNVPGPTASATTSQPSRSVRRRRRAVVLADKLHNLVSIQLDLDEGRPSGRPSTPSRAEVSGLLRGHAGRLRVGRAEAGSDSSSECRALLAEVVGPRLISGKLAGDGLITRRQVPIVELSAATHLRPTRVVRAWHGRIKPRLARGWTPAGPGRPLLYRR